ncbi:MAG TPA: hypothetical protein VKC54_02285 [Patescibacteria group bacterium]|nr:hypothetical protein [Patescibacteria group bacterium]
MKENGRNLETSILNDAFYQECISLAQLSKGDERYGSLLVKNGKIIGKGYNRAIVHRSFPKLKRIIYQGYANHAEIEALNDALMKKRGVKNAEIYVGGYFPKENGLLFLHHEFTCTKCVPILASYKVSKINVPTPYGWISKNMDEALEEAGSYLGGTYKNRIVSVMGRLKLGDLAR